MREHEYFITAIPFSRRILLGGFIILLFMTTADFMIGKFRELSDLKIVVFGLTSIAASFSTLILDRITRVPVIRRLLKLPYIGGVWYGQVLHNDNPRCAIIEIHQTYSHILIEMKTDRTTSYSKSALLCVKPENSCVIEYTYHCDPMIADEEPHEGSCILEITKRNDQVIAIRGRYYTDLSHGPRGSLIFGRSRPSDHCEKIKLRSEGGCEAVWCEPFRL